MLACTIFGWENPNKVNAKELLFLQGCLTNRRINSVPFMLAHMTAVLKKTGTIAFGGLITSIARALNLDTKIATLAPLPLRIINLKFLKDMKLCQNRKDGGYGLMVHGVAIPSVVLPCTRRTDVRMERNWTYDLSAPPFIGPVPPNVPLGDGDETDEEFEQREQSPNHHVSPTHTAPSSSNPSAGTAPGFYITEQMWRDQMAREERRDGLLATIQQQLADNMTFMQTSQQRTDHSLEAIMRSQAALTTRFDEFAASQSDRHRSRSRRPRHSPHADGSTSSMS